ncbi:hypothetical protein U6L75_02880 [Cutibacterium acnes]|jgi:DeoR/GlpR family transcriptional regulator of sugar metabolism|uniref:hypothetical protein n=1 Tax=Cutibacterium granulosum TaxID=33011 RepID=UPI0003E1B9C4|nr:hypothetical protein [Cutibacterium granulosum]KFC15942.1 DeoR family transcriptional regulator [Cutibacterium acnes HL201PA1]WGH36981.1 hypothetical protein OYC58_000489 [Cutibacterium acnes]GAE69588.1 hypothetical protein JCM18909_2822 [Cutibacterium acnes JCM 18909]MEA5643384.1 hypothetical protein [Cutibacterium granulosum]MEA5646638.1 hypothetical protein [Cutibacterium granulosum]
MTAITNYEPAFQRLRDQRGTKVILTGGRYLSWADAFVGPLTTHTSRACAPTPW